MKRKISHKKLAKLIEDVKKDPIAMKEIDNFIERTSSAYQLKDFS